MMFFILQQAAVAGEMRTIELIDGSIISGEVLSLRKGIYTIKSNSLGTISVEDSKIRTIRPVSAVKTPAAESKALQEKMATNAEVMDLIRSLENDPDFKKVLEDPEIMKAVNAGDVAALTANPTFMKLLNNATVKEIQKKTK